MKNTIKYLKAIRRIAAIRKIAIIAMVAVIGFSACAFDDSTGQADTRGNINETLKFENISRLAFMGGSLIYNPDVGASGQINKGSTVAVRLSKVVINPSAANPDEQFNETWRAFGYIKVSSVSVESITLSWSEYNEAGVLKTARIVTVDNGSSGDLNGDGLPDVSFAPPAFKRSGMENAVYLTFTASQVKGNIGMYSTIPEQYSRQAYPNGVLGVNPDGKLLIMKYESSGARAAVRGAEHGDIVIDNLNNNYATIKNGSKFRSAAERIGDTEDDVTIIPTDGFSATADLTPSDGEYEVSNEPFESGTIVRNNDTDHGVVTEKGEPAYFIADEFTIYATPQGLFDALPSSLKNSAAPSAEAAYIEALNEILKISPVTLINAVLNSGPFDSDFTAEANNLKNSIDGSESLLRTVLTNRTFLAKAYPSLCQTPAARSIRDIFPIVSVSFSAGDADVVEEISAEIRRANARFASNMQNNSMQFASGTQDFSRNATKVRDTQGYTDFILEKGALEESFRKKFTKIPGGLLNKVLKAEYSNNGLIKAEVGLYGSYVGVYGWEEMGIGAAVLFLAQIDGVRSTVSVNLELPEINIDVAKNVIIGPVIFTVSINAKPGLKLSAAVESDNTFAGFIGLYGGRAWVGVNYKEVWGIPYDIDFYFRAEQIAENSYYAGPRKALAQASSQTDEFTIEITPSVYVGPYIKFYEALYAKIGVDVEIPNILRIISNKSEQRVFHSMDMVIGGKASAGIEVEILCFTLEKEFGEWQFTPRKRFNVIKEREIFAKETDLPQTYTDKFPVNYVWNTQRTPTDPANGKAMTLYSFTRPYYFQYATNGDVFSRKLYLDSELTAKGAYFKLTKLDGDNNYLFLFFNGTGSLPRVVSQTGKILCYFDEGFIFQPTGTAKAGTDGASAIKNTRWVFLYDEVKNPSALFELKIKKVYTMP